MKNSILFVFVCAFLLSCTVKTGSGTIVEETRSVDPFHGVSVGQGIHVLIAEGDAQTVRVSADDNLIHLLSTQVEAGILKIQFQDKVSLIDANITVTISNLGHLDELTAGSGAEIKTEGVMKHSQNIQFHLSSGSRAEVTVDAPVIQIETGSGADAELKGLTRKLTATASGGSSLDASDLKSEEADLTAESGSSLKAFASLSVSAKASGGASIRYEGPAQLRASTSEDSGGSVRKE